MKKVIGGKRYDTATAKMAGSWNNGESGFEALSEALYQKQTGEFFLHGAGGAMTGYRSYGGDNSWGSGEELIPLTDAEAQEWAEQHMPAEEIEKLFRIPEECNEEVMLSFKIDGVTNAKFRAAARARGISLTAMLKDMVAQLPEV